MSILVTQFEHFISLVKDTSVSDTYREKPATWLFWTISITKFYFRNPSKYNYYSEKCFKSIKSLVKKRTLKFLHKRQHLKLTITTCKSDRHLVFICCTNGLQLMLNEQFEQGLPPNLGYNWSEKKNTVAVIFKL